MLQKLKQSAIVADHIISLYSKTPFSRQFFQLNFPPYQSKLRTLCSNGQLPQALLEMANQGLKMQFEGYDSILNECANRKALKEGQRVHAHIIKTQYLSPVYLSTKLIILYCKCGCLFDARNVFDEMPERNVVSWTAMISGYSKEGFCFEALMLFVQMLRSGTEPNEFTFATILPSCTGDYGFDCGRQIHSLIIMLNYDSHIFVGSSLLDMYAKAGRIHEARLIFDSLIQRDVVSCTAMIAGYAQLGFDEEAVALFRKLLKDGLSSNYVTYANLLTALSGLAALDHGKQVHNQILRRKLPSYVVLHNSMIDMYAKCGNLVYARRVFDDMPEKTVISWNAMLVGYCKHGMGTKVIELFELMKADGKVKPDRVTFLAVLSGCSHGGMEDTGLQIFGQMVARKEGIEPNLEHYGCVVDLLGRSGRLEKALKLIKQMPFKPTAAIWGSLLGSCSVHSNIDVGEYVGRQLLEIEPENAGNYVILSNLYASAGRWEEVKKLREMMKAKAVIKEPGRSWIELDKTLHTFHASDRSHPSKDEVHKKVKELAVRLKEAGYEPDLSCVLYDVDEEQKEKILLGHSEKLALAFGLFNTSEGTPLRVIKNLRICVDCHNFVKIVSKLYGREISLRDKNRFHHIKGGVCSCADYW
ncbi:putative pentatricopeptide repeat-containing protein At3g13770, mitochondrial [Amaranthus tricolor]|uniref:putative pentatricopeptide repeat-containing protein At3g13770, mitochondrial n=1 Tax=Amaranthus tricolor TaxID=29722 RepID=UPI00258FF8E7|nr:putative pentatricopeptide repeat-containing protein At3g13770, mitochondrial [Amaranthus tricolor]